MSDAFSPKFQTTKKRVPRQSRPHHAPVYDSQGGLNEPGRTLPPSLTIILPAYNEFRRIKSTIEVYSSFLRSSSFWKEAATILVVDDGSTDGTSTLVRSMNVSCVSLVENQGKGAAVSFGIQHVASNTNEDALILITDADGSGDVSCLDSAYRELTLLLGDKEGGSEALRWDIPALVVGDRGYQGTSWTRSTLRWGFRTAVQLICGDLRVRDTQCGFKLMTMAAATRLYSHLNLKRWTHDVEVLYRAREWTFAVGETVVGWEDKAGSKLVISPGGTVGVSIAMLWEILQMRLQYALGNWKLPE